MNETVYVFHLIMMISWSGTIHTVCNIHCITHVSRVIILNVYDRMHTLHLIMIFGVPAAQAGTVDCQDKGIADRSQQIEMEEPGLRYRPIL